MTRQELQDFATKTLSRAGAAKHFGPNKVFISSLARGSGMTLDEFKAHLVQASLQGLLHLSRADLVAAMDRKDVAESETYYMTARFHFVLV